MTERPDLSALLASRICHDLISPIGALGNGLELLMMEGDTNAPEMQLMADSLTHANARIRLFRMAFGPTGQSEQRLRLAEMEEVIADLGRARRLQVDWLTPADPTRREVKLVLLALLCLETAMPQGGRIQIAQANGIWALEARGERLNPQPQLWDSLQTAAQDSAITPAQVHFILLREEAARQNRPLLAQVDPAGISLRF